MKPIRLLLLPILFLLTGCPLKGGSPGGGTNLGPPQGGNNNPPGGTTTPPATAESYFTNTVKPMLQSRCVSCHGFPAQGGNATGPLTIYNYNAVKLDLLSGGITDNELMEYSRGIGDHAGHAGGQDFCGGSLNNSPCFEIVSWCQKEGCTAGGGGGANNLPVGKIERISNRGLMEGWARDLDQPNTPVNVEIYADGVRGTGQFLGTVVANIAYSGIDASGNIKFQYQLSATYMNGQSHSYYIYAQDSSSAAMYAQVQSSPKTATRYSVDATAQSAYNANVLTALNNRCNGCHGTFTYNSMLYDYFLNSSGSPGGSTTFSLYQKISGQVGHGGGTHCGGADNLCPNLQSVYTEQFN